MDPNKSENTSPQQDIFVLAESIRSLEENAKKQVEQVSKIRDQFNQLFRHNVYQQPQPRSPKPSRLRVGRHEHRSQPYSPYAYTNPLQSLPPRQPVQNSHYTDTLCSPGSAEYAEYLHPQVTDHYYLQNNHTHNLQSLPSQQLQPAAQSTGQFVGSHQTVRSSLLEQETENPSHYHTQQLFNPSTQVTNVFDFTAGQNSPYQHNTRNLSSLKQQAPVPPAQVTDHLIRGQVYPFQPESDDNNEVQKND